MCSSGLEALTFPCSTKFFKSTDLRFTTSPAIATYTLYISWPPVLRYCQVAVCLGFRSLCPTVLLTTVGGEKIKHRRREEKNEFLFRLAKSTLFCKLWSVLRLVRLTNVYAFVCRLLMLIVSLISFSTFPSLSFP